MDAFKRNSLVKTNSGQKKGAKVNSTTSGAGGGKNEGSRTVFVRDGPAARLSVIISVFSMITAVVAVAILAVTYSTGSPVDQTPTNATSNRTAIIKHFKKPEDPKIWRFGYPPNFEPYSFTEGKKLRGLSLRLVDAVCQEAGRLCSHALVTQEACYSTTNGFGEALFKNWVDACVGFYKTIERANVHTVVATLYNRALSRLITGLKMQIATVQNHNVAMIKGDPTDAICLKKHNIVVKSITEFNTVAEAEESLRKNETQILFLASYFEKTGQTLSTYGSVTGGEALHCAVEGAGLLARKGNEVENWFAPALERVKDTGKMERLCKLYPEPDCALNE